MGLPLTPCDGVGRYCLSLLQWFDFRNHICMVFPRLGASIFDYMKSNGFRPFSLAEVRHMAAQLLTAVQCALAAARRVVVHRQVNGRTNLAP